MWTPLLFLFDFFPFEIVPPRGLIDSGILICIREVQENPKIKFRFANFGLVPGLNWGRPVRLQEGFFKFRFAFFGLVGSLAIVFK